MAGGLQDLAVARANLLWIPPADLIPDPGNIREVYGDIPTLAASIAAQGVKNPMRVRLVDTEEGRKAMVVDGHRRLKAVRYAIEKLGAKLESVPCYPETRGTNEEDRILDMLVANDGQKPLEPLEEGAAFKKLLDMGVPDATIAKRTGKKKRYVEDRLLLVAAPRDVRKAVKEGKLSPAAAKPLIGAPEPERKAVLQKVESRQEQGEGAKPRRATLREVKTGLGLAQTITSTKRLREMRDEAAKLLEGFAGEARAEMAAVVWTLGVVLGEIPWEPRQVGEGDPE